MWGRELSDSEESQSFRTKELLQFGSVGISLAVYCSVGIQGISDDDSSSAQPLSAEYYILQDYVNSEEIGESTLFTLVP